MRPAIASSLLLTFALVLGGFAIAPASAPAATLGFTGTLEFLVYDQFPIAVSDAGVATINGSGPAGHLTGLGLAASQLATSGLTVSFTDPAAFPVAGLQVTVHNGAGSFGGVGGAGFGGPMALAGMLKVCLYGACGGVRSPT